MATNPAEPIGTTRWPRPRRSRRRTGLAAALLLGGVSMLVWGGLLGSAVQSSAGAAAPVAVQACDSTHNVAGVAIQCTISVTNNLNEVTGTRSSTATVTECYGAAGAAPTCTKTTTPYPIQLISSVDQCNSSGNGGGGTMRCIVNVTNNIIGNATTTPATVNQCIGSGAEGTQPTTDCTPTASTTNATVDQCNRSVNGGGAQRRVHCTVTPSTQTAALPVTIKQCNDSENGGGSLATCVAGIVNNVTASPVTSPVTSPTVPTTPVTSPTVPTTPVTSPTVPTTPVSSPPVLTPPVSSPPLTSRPVSSPPVLTPPVSSPPVSSPPVSSPPFVPPPGLTGDSPTHTGSSKSPLIGTGLALLIGGIALLIPRRRRP